MATPYPMEFFRDHDVLRPVRPALFVRSYDEGEVRMLAPWEARSQASHNHEFAWLAEAWKNLPDDMLEEYPSAEHLRKKGLIHVGYRDEQMIVCSSADEARKFAAFLRPMDDFAIVEVKGNVVRRWTAKSQSRRAMPKEVFQDSKDKLMAFVAGLIGTTADELKQAGEAA